MKPLYTKKNGTSQRVAAIEVKMPASYPASRITYESVSVTADGVKTFSVLLNELQALIDYSKISRNSVLVTYGSGEKTIYRLSQHAESISRLCFDRTRVFIPSTYKITSYSYILEPNNSHVYYAHFSTNYNFGDNDVSVPAAGFIFTVYY